MQKNRNENAQDYQAAKSDRSVKFIWKVEQFPITRVCIKYKEKSVFNASSGGPDTLPTPLSAVQNLGRGFWTPVPTPRGWACGPNIIDVDGCESCAQTSKISSVFRPASLSRRLGTSSPGFNARWLYICSDHSNSMAIIAVWLQF
jgi:hypothetical protein